jgi:hypothetical protein
MVDVLTGQVGDRELTPRKDPALASVARAASSASIRDRSAVIAAEPFAKSELELPILAQKIRAGGDLLRARCARAQCRRKFGARQRNADRRSFSLLFSAAFHIASLQW